MTLEDLVGKHVLSGIETGSMTYDEDGWKNENCNYVKFMLDGVSYLAVEDPDDGWRSCCRDLIVEHTNPKISIPNIDVLCSMMPDNKEWGDKNDVLIITDIITGKPILEIGTINTDDYYPCFHFEYHPEDMSCNIGR